MGEQVWVGAVRLSEDGLDEVTGTSVQLRRSEVLVVGQVDLVAERRHPRRLLGGCAVGLAGRVVLQPARHCKR